LNITEYGIILSTEVIMKNHEAFAFAGLLLCAGSSFAQFIPLGPEFQVNTYTTGNQSDPAVAMSSGGAFVVAWNSDGQDGDGWGVFGQSYDANGDPSGTEFPVNTRTIFDQTSPAVEVGSDGEFVIVWSSDSQGGPDLGDEILGRLFNHSGTPLGVDFRIRMPFGGYTSATSPILVGNETDNFVVVWQADDLYGGYISGERFLANGTLLGGFGAPSCGGTWISCRYPGVATDQAGEYVMTWMLSDFNYLENTVYYMRFSATGVALGGAVIVGTASFNGVYSTAVARDAVGNFVVVWHNTAGIQARLYAADGSPLTNEIQVNTHYPGIDAQPRVAMAADGRFLITWASGTSPGNDDSGLSVIARSFRPDGTGVGTEFQVNTTTTGNQWLPVVATNADGDAIISWQSDTSAGSDDSSTSIQAQRFKLDPLDARGWWAAEGDASDSGPWGNHGTLDGSVGFAGGICGLAFDLDGVEDSVSIPHHWSLDPDHGDFSVSFWVKTTEDSDVAVVIDKRSAVLNSGYHAFLWYGMPGFQLKDGLGQTNFFGLTDLADGRLHFVAISIDRDSTGGGRIFVDGELDRVFDPTARPGSLSNTEELRIGRRSEDFGGDGFFDGILDDVRIYGRALTATEVEALYLPACVIFRDSFETGDASSWSGTLR
jgi:hypothetical protein